MIWASNLTFCQVQMITLNSYYPMVFKDPNGTHFTPHTVSNYVLAL